MGGEQIPLHKLDHILNPPFFVPFTRLAEPTVKEKGAAKRRKALILQPVLSCKYLVLSCHM